MGKFLKNTLVKKSQKEMGENKPMVTRGEEVRESQVGVGD